MRATGDGAVGWRRKQQGRHHDGERHADEGGREMEEGRRAGGASEEVGARAGEGRRRGRVRMCGEEM